jgi:hypothetical protein
MLTIIVSILIFFLVLSLVVASLELNGGFVGDSSMVPGILIIMVIILSITVGIGLLTGNINIFIK